MTGNLFDPERLKETLLKPSIAGLAVKNGELIPGCWDAILSRETWDAMSRILTDEKRRTNGNRANEPTWLLSLFGTCGTCDTHMKVTGTDRNRYYVCASNQNCPTRCRVSDAEEFISGLVIARLSQDDAATLLVPPKRATVDSSALHLELAKLDAKRKRTLALFASDDLDESDVTEILKAVKARVTVIDAQLAASDSAPDPLAQFRGNPAQAVWDASEPS